jgi:hypothetical protein
VEILVRNLSPSSRPDSRNNLNSVMTNFWEIICDFLAVSRVKIGCNLEWLRVDVGDFGGTL